MHGWVSLCGAQVSRGVQHLIGEKRAVWLLCECVSIHPIPSDSTLGHKTPRGFSCVGEGGSEEAQLSQLGRMLHRDLFLALTASRLLSWELMTLGGGAG